MIRVNIKKALSLIKTIPAVVRSFRYEEHDRTNFTLTFKKKIKTGDRVEMDIFQNSDDTFTFSNDLYKKIKEAFPRKNVKKYLLTSNNNETIRKELEKKGVEMDLLLTKTIKVKDEHSLAREIIKYSSYIEIYYDCVFEDLQLRSKKNKIWNFILKKLKEWFVEEYPHDENM